VVIEIAFKGNRREFFEWPFEDAPAVKTPVIVEVERGEDLGHVHATGELALRRKAGTTHGKASAKPLHKAIRAASGEEIARATQLRADEMNVRTRAIEKVRTIGLDLKISDTEWQWDKKRLTVYFTAEQRVDFRQLVRQLEGLFGTRVHMWHIGVRDEARRVDGVGRCGRQLCSASWLPELTPVKSSVAKDQHLSTLNPAQISGTCGRLMCCLRYEHEFYVQQRKRFPKEGKVVTTAAGDEKVVSLDIFRETVTLRSPIGESRVMPLEQLKQEMRGEPVTAIEATDAGDATDEAPNGGVPDGDQEERVVALEQRVQPQRPPREPREPTEPTAQRPRRESNQARRPASARTDRPQERPADRPRETPAESPRVAQPPERAPQGEGQEGGGARRRRRGRRGGRGGQRGGQGGGQGGGHEGPGREPGTPPAAGPA
jgi:cell fate regulator YaaT (PSP1 superfamily)